MKKASQFSGSRISCNSHGSEGFRWSEWTLEKDEWKRLTNRKYHATEDEIRWRWDGAESLKSFMAKGFRVFRKFDLFGFTETNMKEWGDLVVCSEWCLCGCTRAWRAMEVLLNDVTQWCGQVLMCVLKYCWLNLSCQWYLVCYCNVWPYQKKY